MLPLFRRLGYALLLCLIFALPAQAERLVWDASTSPETTGYKVHRGEASGTYDTTVDVGNVTEYELTGLDPTRIYYFAVTAYGTLLESGYSNEAVRVPPVVGVAAATDVIVTWQEIGQPMATEYFGECNSDGSIIAAPDGWDYGGPAYVGNIGATYTCPGTGTRNIVSLAIYSKSGGTAGNVRVAIYDSGWDLVCQWDAEMSVADDTPAWREKLAADLTGTKTLTGGENYHLVYSVEVGSYPQFAFQEGSTGDFRYSAVDYTGGFPASLSAPSAGNVGPDGNARIYMRVGVEAATPSGSMQLNSGALSRKLNLARSIGGSL